MQTEAANTIKIIGITGGVGAGKSRILSILKEEYGAFIVLADDVARQLQEPGQPGYDALVELFGAGILNEEGRIDRPRLADIIFHDQARLNQVNAVIHPMTWERIMQMIRSAREPLAAIESALFDRESSRTCDEVWFIDADEETRVRRVMNNRGYTREKALQIIGNQQDRDTFLSFADRIIDNNGTMEDIHRQLKDILQAEGQLL